MNQEEVNFLTKEQLKFIKGRTGSADCEDGRRGECPFGTIFDPQVGLCV